MSNKEIATLAFVIVILFPALVMVGYMIASIIWMLLFEDHD